jgi:hypothetical protein
MSSGWWTSRSIIARSMPATRLRPATPLLARPRPGRLYVTNPTARTPERVQPRSPARSRATCSRTPRRTVLCARGRWLRGRRALGGGGRRRVPCETRRVTASRVLPYGPRAGVGDRVREQRDSDAGGSHGYGNDASAASQFRAIPTSSGRSIIAAPLPCLPKYALVRLRARGRWMRPAGPFPAPRTYP